MNKNGIDDVLPLVSEELVAGYQAKNLDGKTLREVNDEYKAVVQSKGMDFVDGWKLAMFSCAVGMILYLYLIFMKDIPSHIAILAMLAIIVPAYLYNLFPARWRFMKDRETLGWCAPILCEFRQAVKALNPLDLGEPSLYTSDFVWHTLLLLKVQVLAANNTFVSACKAEKPSKSTINKIIGWGEHCGTLFDSVFDASEKFGLDFDKGSLYRAAKEKIDENAHWHS